MRHAFSGDLPAIGNVMAHLPQTPVFNKLSFANAPAIRYGISRDGLPLPSEMTMLYGIFLAFASYAAFSVSDACVKFLNGTLSPYEVAFYGAVLGLLAVVATYAAGAISGIQLSAGQWIGTGLVGWVLASAVFTTLGLFVGYLMPSENAAQVTSLIVVFLSFLGGLFYPLSSMPDFMQTIAKFTPVYGIGELARSPLTGESFDAMWLINALVWLVVFVAGTTWAFRRDTKRV